MSDAVNLADLVGNLDYKLDAIAREIKSARTEVSVATRKVEEVRRDQQRMMTQIADVHQQLSGLRADQEAIRLTLKKGLEQLEAALAANTSALRAQEAQLTALLSAQKEEAARRRLEQEKGQFLIGASGLLGTVKDGAVRFLFASKALEVSDARDIRSESFMAVTDQKTAADVLRTLHDAKDAATDADRAEAAWFLDVSALVTEISSAGDVYRSVTAQAQHTHASLLTKRQSEERAISDLSRPERAGEARARRFRRGAGIVVGFTSVIGAIGVMIAVPELDSDGSPLLLLLFVVVSVIGFVVGWRNSDARRRTRLEKHERKLADVVAQLERLEDTDGERGKAAERKVVEFADRLAKLNVLVSHAGKQLTFALFRTGGNGSEIAQRFSSLLEAAERAKHAWRAKHADARLVLG